MSRERAKGTAAETAVVRYLRDQGATHVERRALHGSVDRGDVTGLPGVVIEVKSHARITLAEFVDEAVEEGVNADAEVAVAWIKRRGTTDPGAWYVAMTGEQFVRLAQDAGYIPRPS